MEIVHKSVGNLTTQISVSKLGYTNTPFWGIIEAQLNM